MCFFSIPTFKEIFRIQEMFSFLIPYSVSVNPWGSQLETSLTFSLSNRQSCSCEKFEKGGRREVGWVGRKCFADNHLRRRKREECCTRMEEEGQTGMRQAKGANIGHKIRNCSLEKKWDLR